MPLPLFIIWLVSCILLLQHRRLFSKYSKRSEAEWRSFDRAAADLSSIGLFTLVFLHKLQIPSTLFGIETNIALFLAGLIFLVIDHEFRKWRIRAKPGTQSSNATI